MPTNARAATAGSIERNAPSELPLPDVLANMVFYVASGRVKENVGQLMALERAEEKQPHERPVLRMKSSISKASEPKNARSSLRLAASSS